MIIKIDKRETARICEAVKYYMPNYKIIIDELEYGDFLFIENKNKAVFEYKTLVDFMWSISDGRMFHQAIRQRQNYKNHFVIIEWDKSNTKKTKKQINKTGTKITKTDIYKSIARLNTITNVIISPKKELSFPLMEEYAEICFEDTPNIFDKKATNKTDNLAYNYLLLIKGINKIKAHNICEKLKLKTVDDLFNLTSKDLAKVRGIGPVTAQKVITSIIKQK